MKRFLLLCTLLCAGCAKKKSDDGPLPDTWVYYIRQGYLAQAFMSGGNWAGGEFLADSTTYATWVPSKSIVGTTVTHPFGVRFIVYIRAGRLYAHDVATNGLQQICNETFANTIVALVDTGTTATSDASTYVLYTTTPAAGLIDFKACRVVGPGGAFPATLEAGIPSTSVFQVRAPRNAADTIFYRVTDTTGVLKRCAFGVFPAFTLTTLSGADDVQEFLVRDSTRVVYRTAASTLMKADVASLPATALYTPGGGETVQLKAKIELGADSEVFFTSHLPGPTVSLVRALYSTGATTTFAGPLAYTTLTLNRVFFTGTRVVWQHIRDATSFMTSYDRATPATNSVLLTGGRTLDPVANAHVIYDLSGWRILFAELNGPTTYRVVKTDAGVLVNEFAFAGAPGSSDAINHMGTSYYDAALDLAAAVSTARFCFVDGVSLLTRLVDLDPLTQLTMGPLPADIASFSLATAWRAPTCVAGVSTAPVQTDIFFFRPDGAGTLQRQTSSPENETALAAQ
jgi:hypothetical protein